MRLELLAAAAMTVVLIADPAVAQDHHGYESWPDEQAVPYMPYEETIADDYNSAAREAWLADCRHRLRARNSGLGGAVIGGVVGGFAGNRISGRGDRAVGTIAGAAVGAAAGAAIDKAEDAGAVRDECEAYLDDYYARYARGGYFTPYGYGSPSGYGCAAPAIAYSSANGCCMTQPMMMVPVPAKPQCTETVEYVYEDVPAPRKRYIPRRSKVVPDKRVKIAPEKRVPTS